MSDKFHPIKKCQYCSKEMSSQNLKRHVNCCKENPNIQKKETTVHKCKNCGKEYNSTENNSENFCSKFCSKSFSTNNSKNLQKNVICSKCGALFKVGLRASNIGLCCNDCKIKNKELKNSEKFKKCSFCEKIISKQNIVKHEKSCIKNENRIKSHYNYKRKDKRNGYIYKITNLITNKIYVGKRAETVEKSKNYMGSGIWLNNSIKKYGKQNFIKEILEIVENGDLNERERFWIEKLNSNDHKIGYNLTKGGDGGNLFGGKKHTVETKIKIKNKATHPQSLETRELISKNHWSKKNPEAFKRACVKGGLSRKSLKHSELTKLKISKSCSGYKWITDGQNNKRIPKESDIPLGFYRGLSINRKLHNL